VVQEVAVSTLLYEALTNAREASKSGSPVTLEVTKATDEKVAKDVPKFLDTVAALVPVEVLAAHAFLFGVVSQSSDPDDNGPVVVTITDETAAMWFWGGLLVAAWLLYLIPHWVHKGLDWWDAIRMLIPPFAFAAWTILGKSTLFDAVRDWDNVTRAAVGVGIGFGALIASKALADEAESKPQKPAQVASFS
jgi:hypothetical protein